MAFQSKKRKQEYTRLEEILRSEGKHFDQLKNIDTDRNWERFVERVHEPGYARKEKHSFRTTTRVIYRIAAVAIIIFLVSATVYLTIHQSDLNVREISNLERNTEIYLEDGSSITLNKGSVLRYANIDNQKKREVYLDGEAFFDIARKEGVPFFIYLENVTVKVMGTSFNINENKKGDVKVNVISGKVALYEKGNANNPIFVETGEYAYYNRSTNTINSERYISDNFLFWKTGNLSFRNDNLEEVFKVLGESYDVYIKVGDPGILNNQLTAECKGQELLEILDELSILFDLKYSQEGDTILIQMQ